MTAQTRTPLDVLRSNIGKSFAGSPSPFTYWLKPQILAADPGRVSFSFTVRKDMINPIGTLHGGVTAAIMDDVIGATLYTLNEEHFYTTINNVVDYFASAREGEMIIAETQLIKKGRQIVNAQCEIWNAGKTKMIARGYSNLLKTGIKK